MHLKSWKFFPSSSSLFSVTQHLKKKRNFLNFLALLFTFGNLYFCTVFTIEKFSKEITNIESFFSSIFFCFFFFSLLFLLLIFSLFFSFLLSLSLPLSPPLPNPSIIFKKQKKKHTEKFNIC